MSLIIGRIYITKRDGTPYRIFKSNGGLGYYSGRGCTKQTAIPNNFVQRRDVRNATLEEVNKFLELEMQNGMARTVNK